MMRFLTVLGLLCVCSAGLAQAGPNAGGTLIVHTDTSVIFCTDTDYNGLSGIECANDFDCPPYDDEALCQANMESANPTGRADASTQVWWVLAAFPEGSCPRLAGITFGVTWDVEQNISIVGFGPGGDFEIPDTGWPAFLGTGTAVTWGAAQTSQLVEVYWFAGAAYYGPEEFRVTPHPTQTGQFADDAVPSNIDPIAGYSYLGLGGATGLNVLPGPQGPTTGACCFADGSCQVLTQDDCEIDGGAYQGNDTTCEEANCPQPTGACCFANGACQVLTASECAAGDGDYQGDGTDCDPNLCPQPPGTGACCFADGSCEVLSASDCGTAGGDYQGDDTVCDPNTCPQPPATGACCFADGSCELLTESDCTTAGGDYQGDDTVCDPNTCPQPPATGACCFADGSCELLTESDCATAGGDYQGDDTVCDPNTCPQPPTTGACCFTDGSCQVLSSGACETAGGEYQGDDTVCDPNTCPQPPPTGACCFADGSCQLLTESDCATAGGDYQGDDAVCDPNTCPQPPATGACCFADGSCQVLTESDCATLGGDYQGDGTDCDPNTCPQPPTTGACCFADGTCQVLSSGACDTAGGDYQGDDTVCDPDPCVEGEPESCGLGFWKNNPDVWGPTGYSPDDLLGDTFEIPSELSSLSDDTLMEALQYSGGPGTLGGAQLLLRTAVVALLNAAHPDINYPLSVDTIVELVDEALATLNRREMSDLRTHLESFNAGPCPEEELLGSGGSGGGRSESTGDTIGIRVQPNPANHDAWIEWSTPAAGMTELVVFDANGRLLRTLVTGDLGAGSHRAAWDGRDTNGVLVPSGVYYYRLRIGQEVRSDKIFVVR